MTTVAVLALCSLSACNKRNSGSPTATNGTGPQGTSLPSQTVPNTPSIVPANNAAAGITAIRPQGATAESPDAETVALVYYSLAGQAPPVEDWAKQEFQFTGNEFERARKTDAALATYKSKVAFANTVGHMTLPLNSNLSDYDDKNGEFYVDAFSPTSVFSFPFQNSTYKITFVNGDAAQHWKLTATDAARVIERNSGGHSILVSANVDLVGVQPAADGGTIMALVKSYNIESAGRREPLGSVTVTPPSMR